jgi:hypothetical protein
VVSPKNLEQVVVGSIARSALFFARTRSGAGQTQ